MRILPLRACAALLGAAVCSLPLAWGTPGRAIEEVELQLPLLETSFRVKVGELEDPDRLLNGSSDLAELNRALDGALGRRIQEIFLTPLPVQTTAMVQQAAGTPLLEQALLAASTLTRVDGLPLDPNGGGIEPVLRRAAAGGELSALTLLQALPGQVATIDLEAALRNLQRIVRQRRQAEVIIASQPAASVDPRFSAPGPFGLDLRRLELRVPHRSGALEVEMVLPQGGGNGRLVVISHGLWDGPESFLGWAEHLASHGHAVLLPRHPGSDSSHQRAMLSGKEPPPAPDELRLRPLDVTAVLDAVAAGKVPAIAPAAAERVVVLGHSWGATTALQLAGTRPSSTRLRQRCHRLNDPDRNLSWVLQCSFLDAADRAGLADRRVIAAVAVSPPLNLLFDHEAGATASARVLLVTGSRDWVVPPDPEAIDRFEAPASRGHQLVVVQGGDHFNLRSPQGYGGGPLRGLLLAWTRGAYEAGEAVLPGPQAPSLLPAGGWGDAELPLVAAKGPAPHR